ncbi:MAG: PstS family phosphate ABC transporter substrate-binding protein [Anaerolineae bacterium]|nr:PstS family phosphate ABC transporter substrate-binding protein [Anaerolineae bacterium]
MKRIPLVAGLISLVLLVAFSLTGAASPSAAHLQVTATPSPTPLPRTPLLDAIAADYPRVDGSTSTYPMQILIACAVTGRGCWVDYSEWEPTPTVWPDVEGQSVPDIVHSGTHGAYMRLIAGDADLILVAREPSESEREAATGARLSLDVRPVALDGLVFIVHPENPVESLTLDQIRDIYTGRTTNWRKLGVRMPPDAEAITAYHREPDSGSRELMDKLVMVEAPMIKADELMMFTMNGLIEAVAFDPSGIGYSVYYYVTHVSPLARWSAYLPWSVKLVAVDGVAPSPETFRDGAYPLTEPVYIVTRGDQAADSTTLLLRDWLLTAEGQRVVELSGYVGVGADEPE